MVDVTGIECISLSIQTQLRGVHPHRVRGRDRRHGHGGGQLRQGKRAQPGDGAAARRPQEGAQAALRR